MTSHDVFLIRHGAAAGSWTESSDPGLSAVGRAQALEIATHFAPRTPCAIVSSPLTRARETAQPLATRWHCAVDLDARVREIPTAVPMAERGVWLEAVMAAEWPTLAAVLHEWRAHALRAVLECGRDTLIFTHFMVINALVGLATGDDRVRCFDPDYGSITHLRCVGARLELVALGAARTTPLYL